MAIAKASAGASIASTLLCGCRIIVITAMFIGSALIVGLNLRRYDAGRLLASEDGLIAAQVSQYSPIWQPSPDAAQQTTIAAFLRQHGLADLKALLRRADEEPGWYWHAHLINSECAIRKSSRNISQVSIWKPRTTASQPDRSRAG
jgi:hypothetical protein